MRSNKAIEVIILADVEKKTSVENNQCVYTARNRIGVLELVVTVPVDGLKKGVSVWMTSLANDLLESKDAVDVGNCRFQ